MSELLRLDNDYKNWINELGERYRKSQIKAALRVNNEMLFFYWSIGRDIIDKRANSKWGNKFFRNMSLDLTEMIPNVKGFSPTNLRYMVRFYELFQNIEIVPQVGEQMDVTNNKVFMIPCCYVVVEVKVVEFEPGFISQTATYVSAVNHMLKGDVDTQTIGLLICRTKDNILAKYAVETSTEPIGISEYELNSLMPKELQGTLPTIEELERGLRGVNKE